MTDYCKCQNSLCLSRMGCYRYMARDGYRQCYAEFKPDSRGRCEYFIPLMKGEEHDSKTLRLQK